MHELHGARDGLSIRTQILQKSAFRKTEIGVSLLPHGSIVGLNEGLYLSPRFIEDRELMEKIESEVEVKAFNLLILRRGARIELATSRLGNGSRL